LIPDSGYRRFAKDVPMMNVAEPFKNQQQTVGHFSPLVRFATCDIPLDVLSQTILHLKRPTIPHGPVSTWLEYSN
jgi:hypothetical protein